MSAQIPETMLLSDLLKPSGYDCPEDLQGRTFAEATAGGDVQTNKASTIDVSAYTEPIVIKPDTDYESMKKTTVTLSNIPSVPTIESNKAATIDVSTYTEPVEITPTEGNDGMAKTTVTLTNIPAGSTLYCWYDTGRALYTTTETPTTDNKALKGGNSGFSVLTISSVSESFSSITVNDVTYARDSERDFDVSTL